ncbi:hypothetical protein CLOBAR_01192 [Intestinibacter bartlettii DSM 16795]|nr:hypothetical protein CLOBAR_01192 [Intestinibacter bartlettii DSM 16795]
MKNTILYILFVMYKSTKTIRNMIQFKYNYRYRYNTFINWLI